MLPRTAHTARGSSSSIRLTSPSGNLHFTFFLTNNRAGYSISYNGHLLIDKSELSLSFKGENDFEGNLSFKNPVFRQGRETYSLIVGKTSQVNDPYREVRIPLSESIRPFRQVILVVRAFNDGIAFHYEFPRQPGRDSFILTRESTQFNLVGDPLVHALFLPGFTTSHEGEYTHIQWQSVKPDTLMDMPVLLEFPVEKNTIYMGITEAALVDYAGMYLVKHNGVLRGTLSPLPGQTENKVKAILPHSSPWRVMLISDRIGALIESNIITDLNEPCRIKDLSWIRPGKTTFPWWNGNVTPDTLNAPGNNFVTAQYYIDFCARTGLEYHSVVEYGLHEWYVNDGAGFMPGPHADPTRAVPGLDMQQVCDYAHSKGVGIRVWVHWAALYPKLDSAFARFEKWGISGMMVDFMDRDDQEMVNIQTEILQKAAAHHLHIQFHGAYKPTGLSRTWPNEFTREGTLNYEANKWSKRVNPDHDINFPFTRMLAGPTDFHLGGFRSVTDSQFVIQYTRPLMLGTRCHMLAMYVVLESYLGMVCDYPAAYEGQPGFEFLQKVPTVWDETKVLDAKVGEYILIARRKKKDWYVGAITDHHPRLLKIPLDFLEEGAYTATLYTDAPDAVREPNHLVKEVHVVKRIDVLTATLTGGGGMVLHIKAQE
ncbi:glycoside hydrolase family 97 protein [Flavitalea flava]